MRILTEDKIDVLSGGYISEYLNDQSKHSVEMLQNDHPSIQWIAGIPDRFHKSRSGANYIKYSIVALGYPSFNGFYLGNLQADEMTFRIFEDDNGTLTQHCVEVIRVNNFNPYNYFTIDDDIYNDYLYSLTDLGCSVDVLSKGFRIEMDFKVETNLLPDPIEIKANKGTTLNYVHPDTNFRYIKFRGNLMKNNEIISVSDKKAFNQKITVGTYFLSEKEIRYFMSPPSDWWSEWEIPHVTTGVQERILQITEIVGDGTSENAITFIVREKEYSPTPGIYTNQPYALTLAQPSFNWSYMQEIDITNDVRFYCKESFRPIRLGLLRAGYLQTLPNPQVGMTRAYRDNSVSEDLINGTHHFSNRKIGRIYSGNMTLSREEASNLLAFIEHQRAKPFPVEILTNMTEEKPTTFYGYFNNTPTESFNQRRGVIRDMNFSIQQVF